MYPLPLDLPSTGWVVRVAITPSSNEGYMVIFLTGSPPDENAQALNWNMQYLDSRVSRNSYFNASWGIEENDGGLPVSYPDRHEVQFNYTSTSYEITISGTRQSAFDFKHRTTAKITGVIVSGFFSDALAEVLTYKKTQVSASKCSIVFDSYTGGGYLNTTLPSGALTVESWVLADMVTGGVPWIGNSYKTDKKWELYLTTTGIYSMQTGGFFFQYNGANPTDSNWHHIALSGNSFYVDGVLMNNNVRSYLGNDTHLWIGFFPSRFTATSGSGGLDQNTGTLYIRDFRVWSVIRSASDIKLYRDAVDNNAPGLMTRLLFEQNVGDSSPAWQSWAASSVKYDCDTTIWTRFFKCLNGRYSSLRLDLPPATIMRLAANATRVRICTIGNSSDCMISRPGSFPIKKLAMGRTITFDTDFCMSSCVSTTWSGPRASSMATGDCTGNDTGALTVADGFNHPLVWANCNGNGAHATVTDNGYCSWIGSGGSDNLEISMDATVPFDQYQEQPFMYLPSEIDYYDVRDLATSKVACSYMGADCGGVTCTDGLGTTCRLRRGGAMASQFGEYSWVKVTTTTTTTKTTSTSTGTTATTSTLTTSITSTSSSRTTSSSTITTSSRTTSTSSYTTSTSSATTSTTSATAVTTTTTFNDWDSSTSTRATTTTTMMSSGASSSSSSTRATTTSMMSSGASSSSSSTRAATTTMMSSGVSSSSSSTRATTTRISSGTNTSTRPRIATVTKTATETSTQTTTTVTSTTRTTTTAVPGAPTETSTTLTATTSTTTITAPPPPAAVSDPPATCADSATYKDAKGLTCEDWKGLNCSNASGYTQEVLAGIRKSCPVACGICILAPPFVAQAVRKVSSELAVTVDLTQLDEDARIAAMKACISTALGVPLPNVVELEITVVKSRRLQGGAPQYKVKYEVVVPPRLQVRDIILQATSLSLPGSDSLQTFSQVLSFGFGVDTSTLDVQVTSKPYAQLVEATFEDDGKTVVGTVTPVPAPAPGGLAPAPGGNGSIVADNCVDEGKFLDEQGEGCSGWVGLDCTSTKWLRSERPYTLKGLRQVLTSCPLSCGKCSPPTRLTFDQLRDQCIDDPLVAGWCARWRGLNCSSAADLGYSSSYAALLLDRCPQSCGMCPASAVACVDAPGFLDDQGQPCSSWKGFSCTKEYAGYTRKGMLEVQAACPASCGFCGTQAGRSLALAQQPDQCADNPDFTYLQQFTCRDFVGRACTYATLYLEPRWLLGPSAVSTWHQRLWKSCPVSCTRCNPQGRPTPKDLLIECEDDPYFAEWCSVKWKGQDCSRWEGSVRLVVDGEAVKYNATLLGRCPETCGLCTKPTCGDGTYRNKVAHKCSLCQPGRYAKGVRANAECRPAEPGFSVPQEGSTEQYPCDRGQFTSISGQARCSNCNPGYYAASRGMSSCMACEPGWFQEQPGQTECVRCEEGTYAQSNASSACDRCPFDYTTLLQASTAIEACVCPAGTYKPYNRTGGCRACPIAINCPGGHQFVDNSFDDSPRLMAGVMSLPEEPFSAYTCTAKDACLDERPLPYSEDAMTQVCPDLTSGPRCWTCPDNGTGAFHDDDGVCQPCDQMGRRIVGVTGFFVLQFYGTWKAYRAEGAIQTGAKIMVMSALNFLQVLATLVQIPLVWPVDMAWLVAFLNWFNYDGATSDIFQFREECFFAPTLLARVMRDVFLPLLPFINFAVLGVIYRLIKRKMVWSMAMNVIASVWTGFFVNLSVMALQLFPGEQMPNGKVYMVSYPGVEVGTKEWKQGVPVSLVAIAFYCCTFLAYTLHAVILAPSKQEDEEWLETRDFMLGETDTTCYWWCLVDLFYNFAVALVQALSPNVYVSLYLSCAVLLAYTGMIIYFQPSIYKLANHVNMMLNVGMFIFTALSLGLIDVTLIDQSENRKDFGPILVALLIILLVWIVLRIAYALYTRCAVSQLELNVEEAHRARIVLQSVILLPEQEFIQSLGDVWDPEVHTWTQFNQMLIPVFFKQQPGSWLLEQRAKHGIEFKVFRHEECRMQALACSRRGLVAQRLEEYCKITNLTHTMATKVLKPAWRNSKVVDGVVQPPGPIISHAASRIESNRATQNVLLHVLPEVPAGYMNPEKGDPEATTSLASKGVVKLLTRLETGRSKLGKRVAQKSRSVLHECGATLVDEDSFVEELVGLVGMPEAELREVYRHLDVNHRGQLKASHIVTQLKLLGDIPRDYDEAQAERAEQSQSLDEHAGHREESCDLEGHTSHFKKGHGKGKYGDHPVHHHHLSGEHHEDGERSAEAAASIGDMATPELDDKDAEAATAPPSSSADEDVVVAEEEANVRNVII